MSDIGSIGVPPVTVPDAPPAGSTGVPPVTDTSAAPDQASSTGVGGTGVPPVIDPAARLLKLESFLSERDKEITELKNNLVVIKSAAEKSAGDVKERETALSKTLTALRLSILQANPQIPEEMLTGGNVEELMVSLEKAGKLVARIKAQPPVTQGSPAGAPARTGPDTSAMSAREKIVQGLKGK